MDGRRIADQIDAMAIDTLTEVGLEMEDDLRDSIDTAYPPASAPGQAPHRRSGALQRAVYSVVDEFVDSGPVLTIGYNRSVAPHSEYLTHGTKNMAPRPSIAPLVERWRGARFEEAVNRAMASYTKSQERW